MSKSAAKTISQANPQATTERLLTTAPQPEKRANAKQDKRKSREDEDTQVVSDADAPQGGDMVVAAAPAASDAPMVLAQASTAVAETSTAAAGAAAAAAVSGWVIGLAALGGLTLVADSGSNSDTTPTNPNSGSTTTPTSPASISGTAIDGYLSGADVYLVAPDGTRTQAGTTDGDGKFTIQNPNGYVIEIEGGTNTDTGLTNVVVLRAPAATEGTIVVTPLTTLIQTLVAENGLTASAAEAAVRSKLGITGNVDLLTLDPIAPATANVDVQKANVQIATALAMTADGDEAQAVLEALATQLNAATSTLDLTQELVTSLAAAPSIDQSTLDNISASLSAIAQAASLEDIAIAQEDALTGPPPFAAQELNGVISFTNAFDPISFTAADGVVTFKSGALTADVTVSDLGGTTLQLASDQTLEIDPAIFVGEAEGELSSLAGVRITGDGTFSLTGSAPVDLGTVQLEDVQGLIAKLTKASNWAEAIGDGSFAYQLDESVDYSQLNNRAGPNVEQYTAMAFASNYSDIGGNDYFGYYDLTDSVSNLLSLAAEFPGLYAANVSSIYSSDTASLVDFKTLYDVNPEYTYINLGDTVENISAGIDELFSEIDQAEYVQYPFTIFIRESDNDTVESINSAAKAFRDARLEFDGSNYNWTVYVLADDRDAPYTFDLEALLINEIKGGEGDNDAVVLANADARPANPWGLKEIDVTGVESVTLNVTADTMIDSIAVVGNQAAQSAVHLTIDAKGFDFATFFTEIYNATAGESSITILGTGDVNLGALEGEISAASRTVSIDASALTSGAMTIEDTEYLEFLDGSTSGSASLSIIGSAGNDVIKTSWGDDTINGGDGSDIIRSGYGVDALTGGAGADTFIFDDADDYYGPQDFGAVITDLAVGDKIDLSAISTSFSLVGGMGETSSTAFDAWIETIDEKDYLAFERAVDDSNPALIEIGTAVPGTYANWTVTSGVITIA